MAESVVKASGTEDEFMAGAVKRRWWPFFLKVAVSTILIVFLVATHDISEAIHHLSGIQTPWLFGGLLLLGFGIFLAGLRWAVVLDGMEIGLRLGGVFRIVLIGLFFSQALPSTIGGDAVRAWQIHQVIASVSLALRSIILDRLAGLAGLLLLVSMALPLLFQITDSEVAHVTMASLTALALVGLAAVLVFDRLPTVALRGHIYEFLIHISKDARKALLASRRAPLVIGLSALIHTLSALTVFCLAQGLGIMVGIVECLVLVPPVIMLMVLPISLAGWGVREGAMIAALGFVNVPASEALLLSIAFGLAVLLTNLPGGAVWLLTRTPHTTREGITK